MEENEEVVDSQDIESEAKEMGWVPKESFRGPEEKWIDAETFVQRGREILPIVKSRLEKEKQAVSKLQAEINEIKQAQREWVEMERKRLSRQLEEQEAAVKAARKEAIETGDGDRVNQLDDELHEIRKAKETPQEKPQPQVDPQFEEWVNREENSWYLEDMEAQGLADRIGLRLAKQGLTGMNLYEAVSKEMRVKYAPLQNRRSPVESSGYAGMPVAGKGRKMSYADLPRDAKEACERQIRHGLVKDREEYVKNYQEVYGG